MTSHGAHRTLIAAVIAAIALTGCSPQPTPADNQQTPVALESETTIRAKGIVEPARTTQLAFQSRGIVESVAVKPGDEVKAGETLVTLRTSDLEAAVKSAEDALELAKIEAERAAISASPEEVAAAQAAYDAAQAKLAEVSDGPARADVLTAESSVASARQQLAQIEASYSADERVARSSLEVAQSKLAELKAGPTPEDLKTAEIGVEQAKLSLWSAQLSRDGLAGSPYPVPEYQLKAQEALLSAAELAVQSAELDLQKLKSGPSAEELATAQASVDQAQAQLNAKLATKEQSLASARAAVAAAEADLDRLRSGSSASEIKTAMSGVASGKASLAEKSSRSVALDLRAAKIRVAQAERDLAEASADLEDARLVAPYDCTIVSIDADEDDTVQAGANAAIVADLDSLQVEVTDLDENSIPLLPLGKKATVRISAFDDKTLEGTLTAVSLQGITSEAGDVTYPATVTLDRQDADLRWGMTARLEFSTR